MTEPLKLCKDCKYCVPDTSGGYKFARCGKITTTDIITGEVKPKWYCSINRDSGWFGSRFILFDCGKEGRHWEVKQ